MELLDDFSHHDTHPYANDKRQVPLIIAGMLVTLFALIGFLAFLGMHTPRT